MVAAYETIADRAKYGLLVDEFYAGQTKHGVNGTVYIVDKSTIFIKGFSLDKFAIDAFFCIQKKGSGQKILINYPADKSER